MNSHSRLSALLHLPRLTRLTQHITRCVSVSLTLHALSCVMCVEAKPSSKTSSKPSPAREALALLKVGAELEGELPSAPLLEARRLINSGEALKALEGPLKSPPTALPTLSRAERRAWRGERKALLQDAYILAWRALQREAARSAGLNELEREAEEALRQGALPPARQPFQARALPTEELSDPNLNTIEALFKARAYTPTLKALELFQQHSELSPYERGRTSLIKAVILMRLYTTPELAVEELLKVDRLIQQAPQLTPDLLELKGSLKRYQAILYARLERWDEAISAHRDALTLAHGHRLDEARYQVGRLYHQAGRYAEAVRAHTTYLHTQKPRDPARARWFLGWSHYRAGECAEARAVWRPLFKRANLLEGPQARYWSARCLAKEGKRPQALKALRELRSAAPISYYGLLGRQLEARLRGHPLRWPHPLRASARRAHLRVARPTPIEVLTKGRAWRASAAQPLWWALALKRVGLDERAVAQWSEACEGAGWSRLKRALRRNSSKLCAQSALAVGAYGALWKRASREGGGWRVASYEGLLKRSVSDRVGAYPLAYEGLVRASAAQEALSPWWLLAHMYQETRYRPGLVSHAQAIGLMQLLERTGLRLSAELGWPPPPFKGERLFEPGVSLRLAARYLKLLWEDLGHPILAMGAYNGGPMRLSEHVERHAELPFDELIEELGAHESRNYMRKIVDHTLRYLTLYGTDEEWRVWVERLALPERAPTPRGEVGF